MAHHHNTDNEFRHTMTFYEQVRWFRMKRDSFMRGGELNKERWKEYCVKWCCEGPYNSKLSKKFGTHFSLANSSDMIWGLIEKVFEMNRQGGLKKESKSTRKKANPELKQTAFTCLQGILISISYQLS